ncbi:hypothetical protein CEXT_679291 [Caerostris extrusa]|uniref:Uncharacterized protein n=1 Tax=Caerostris extrusa TaxID=172846 RepID=A0AAV4NMM1_CAEEX|nr:hypothetical protein CEXT_679291 [Caerostris extrusa]
MDGKQVAPNANNYCEECIDVNFKALNVLLLTRNLVKIGTSKRPMLFEHFFHPFENILKDKTFIDESKVSIASFVRGDSTIRPIAERDDYSFKYILAKTGKWECMG